MFEAMYLTIIFSIHIIIDQLLFGLLTLVNPEREQLDICRSMERLQLLAYLDGIVAIFLTINMLLIV